MHNDIYLADNTILTIRQIIITYNGLENKNVVVVLLTLALVKFLVCNLNVQVQNECIQSDHGPRTIKFFQLTRSLPYAICSIVSQTHKLKIAFILNNIVFDR